MTLFSTDPIINLVVFMMALISIGSLLVSVFDRRKPVWQAVARSTFYGALAMICLLEYAYATKLWVIGIVLFGIPQLYWMYQAARLWYQRWGRA